MAFFKATKDEIELTLHNMEGYDSQTLVFIYLNDLLAAYEHHYMHMEEDLAE